jgi:pathogenesis-related protein 1
MSSKYTLAMLTTSLLLVSCNATPVVGSGGTATTTSVSVSSSEMVSAHNQVRGKHGLSGLQWSGELANYAQEWANHLKNTNRCNMRHRPPSSKHGENLFWASPMEWSDGKNELQAISSRRVVEDWASEEKFYNYQRNSCQRGQMCGHYTQIVWRDTKKVGCAVAVCSDKSQIWVCNYSPAGNYVGIKPY